MNALRLVAVCLLLLLPSGWAVSPKEIEDLSDPEPAGGAAIPGPCPVVGGFATNRLSCFFTCASTIRIGISVSSGAFTKVNGSGSCLGATVSCSGGSSCSGRSRDAARFTGVGACSATRTGLLVGTWTLNCVIST